MTLAKIEKIRKKDNFFGGRSIVIPMKYICNIKKNPLINDLYLTTIGFYPKAKHHYRKRPNGCVHNILIYCIDGKGYISIKNTLYTLTSNKCLIIPACQSHFYHADNKNPWSIYWFSFAGSKCNCFSHFFSRTIHIDKTPNSRIADRINLLNEILKTLELGLSNEHIEYANLSLHSLLATFFYIETYRAIIGVEKKDPVESAIAFMHDNIYNILLLKDISNHVSLSESHFSKIFKQRTGSSPVDYFIHLKMLEATKLLRLTNLRIKEISYRLGYEDPCYFSRLFTKHFGKPPGSFTNHRELYPIGNQ